MKDTESRKVGLVLGGGGARGMAHIGVLRALQEHGYQPDAIAGCSIGAIVGAMYGSGMTPDEISIAIDDVDHLGVLDFGVRGGIIGGKRISKKIAEYHVKTFEELHIPLKMTAVDVQSGELVILGAGLLAPALSATIALPGILSPAPHMGRVFLDGGLLNNLPVDVIRTMTHSPVVAVDVAAPPNRPLDFESKHGIVDTIRKLKKNKFRTLTIELFMKSFDIPQTMLTNMRLAMQPPNLLIRPQLALDFGIEDFHRLEEAEEEGYRCACEQLDSAVL